VICGLQISRSTHILEGHVFERSGRRCSILENSRLRRGRRWNRRQGTARAPRVARKIGALDHDRRELISRHAADELTGDEYIAANRALDERLERLVRAKDKLVTALRTTHQEDFVDASVRQFCATANARLQACSGFDTNRQFLVDHIERVIFERYNVAIVGAVPARTEAGESKLPFRIAGKIDIVAIRSNASRKAALGAMQSLASVSDRPTTEDPSVSLPPISYAEVVV